MALSNVFGISLDECTSRFSDHVNRDMTVNRAWGSIEHSPQINFLEPIAAEQKRSAESESNVTVRTSSPSRNTSLGLHLVHAPSKTSCLDIIFVHGLGGDSRKTWSKDHNPELFWPGLWLPLEAELQRARIFTFGYNANFRPGEAKSAANMSDFAKELLYELRFGRTDDGENFGIGNAPLIFVAHSMGGLIVKKACLLGQNDDHYKALVRSASAIVFLSTPHRGSNLAEILNRILIASFQSARKFITDLSRSSTALEEINEQFRHIAPRLSIWSFYETLPTSIGPRKLMVLEKDSAILGYSKEISRPLYADHHGVCKYSGPEDANYVSVRNALGTLGDQIARKVGVSADKAMDELQTLQGLFSASFEYDDDLNKQNRLRVEGTCKWIFNESGMSDWISTSGACHLVWFSAAPASGKSVLSAYIVTSLQERGLTPQYFFFNFRDQHKQSVAGLLRSIAFQLAAENFPFRRSFLDLLKQGFRVDKADASVIWHKVYENLVFKMNHQEPLFWIVDALDECDSPNLLLDLFRTCSSSNVPLRIFIASRQIESIHIGVARVAKSVKLTKLEKHGSVHNLQDIQCLAEQEVIHMRGSEQIKNRVVQKILARAEGNFLWTRLVLEEIIYCHTESSVEETLDELPNDMHKLYERMECAILKLPRKSSQLLAKTLLQWTTGARRPMSLRELSQALKPEFPEILDLKRSISDVCSQFIRIDNSDYVSMIHQTAREYLTQPRETELFIDMQANHEALCIKTVSALLELRTTSEMANDAGTQSYLLYAATSWMFHLSASKSASIKILDLLVRLFNSSAFPSWVHLLSRTSHLDILIRSSKSLNSFTTSIRKADTSKSLLLRQLSDLQLLEKWAVDLMKIVAKFSKSLLKYPRAIYSLVSPFSPETSALRQQPYCKNDRDLCVVSALDSRWTDLLATIALPEGFRGYKLVCAGPHIAVLGDRGGIYIWDSQTFVNVHVIEHGEHVTWISFNAQGDKLVTYGLQTTKLWTIPSGRVLCTVNNIKEARAMALLLANNDTRILAAFHDETFRYFDIEQIGTGWQFLHPTLQENLSAGAAASWPICVAFSKDGSYAGIAYRGYPLSVWSLESGTCVSICKRAQGNKFTADEYSAEGCFAWRFVWNPVTDHIIGFRKEGFVFKWSPLTGEYQENQAHAGDVAASSDGKLFLTSTNSGIVTVWDFANFSVIYQLTTNDLLVGLAFSPDCLRFYDLRFGTVSSVNVWEPNSLLRFSDTEETISDLASDTAFSMPTAQISEARLKKFEAISALSACPNGKCLCVGIDDGSIELRSADGSDKVEVGKFNNFMVRRLIWSKDSQYIAAADLGGGIIISQIETTDYSHLTETTRIVPLKNPKIRREGHVIHEMLFSPDSTLLLVVMNLSAHVWSLEDAKLRASENISDGDSRKWLSHPTQDQLVLGIGRGDVRVFEWQNLLERSSPVSYLHTDPVRQGLVLGPSSGGDIGTATKLTSLAISAPESISAEVKAMVTQDLKHVLIRFSSDNFTRLGRFFIVPLSELDPIKAGVNMINTVAIRSATIPDDVRSQVRVPLGILPGNRLVFLDKDLWVSCYKLDAFAHQSTSPPSGQPRNEGDDLVQRYYFIPDDWAMGGSLDLCCMTADGTLFYPRDDKVSMIKADLSRPAF